MKDNERKLYKEALGRIPVRMGKIKMEVLEHYDGSCKVDKKRVFAKAAIPAAVLMCLVLLAVTVVPKNDVGSLKVYAANGEYVELGKDAVSLKQKYDGYLNTVSLGDDGEIEKYTCGFAFSVGYEADKVEKITYKIVGEKTALHIREFDQNNVWFVAVTGKEWEPSNGSYPFEYRRITEEGEKAYFVYLGNEVQATDENQNGLNYLLELKIDKDKNGMPYAEPFEIEMEIEKKDGTTIERTLEFEPKIEKIEDSENGDAVTNELWVRMR